MGKYRYFFQASLLNRQDTSATLRSVSGDSHNAR
jgi:hypothetical protein